MGVCTQRAIRRWSWEGGGVKVLEPPLHAQYHFPGGPDPRVLLEYPVQMPILKADLSRAMAMPVGGARVQPLLGLDHCISRCSSTCSRQDGCIRMPHQDRIVQDGVQLRELWHPCYQQLNCLSCGATMAPTISQHPRKLLEACKCIIMQWMSYIRQVHTSSGSPSLAGEGRVV